MPCSLTIPTRRAQQNIRDHRRDFNHPACPRCPFSLPPPQRAGSPAGQLPRCRRKSWPPPPAWIHPPGVRSGPWSPPDCDREASRSRADPLPERSKWTHGVSAASTVTAITTRLKKGLQKMVNRASACAPCKSLHNMMGCVGPSFTSSRGKSLSLLLARGC